VREKDESKELWEGARSGTQAALDVFNADEVCTNFNRYLTQILTCQQTGDIRKVQDLMPQMVQDAHVIYTDIPSRDEPRSSLARYLLWHHPDAETGFQQLLRRMKDTSVKPLMPLLSQLRVTKSEAEISNMRNAGRWSGRAFTKAMGQSWSTEKNLHTFLDYHFKINGCEEEAYEPVIAGGKVPLNFSRMA
jgi:intermediate cleaving peptidase 55